MLLIFLLLLAALDGWHQRSERRVTVCGRCWALQGWLRLGRLHLRREPVRATVCTSRRPGRVSPPHTRDQEAELRAWGKVEGAVWDKVKETYWNVKSFCCCVVRAPYHRNV